MGKFTSISGSLICDSAQADFIKEVLPLTLNDAGDYQLSYEQAVLYQNGWIFPERKINWLSYVFYGASIKSNAVDYFLYQIIFCAAKLRTSDVEEKELDGCFYLFGEDNDRFVWEINQNTIRVYQVDEEYEKESLKLKRIIKI